MARRFTEDEVRELIEAAVAPLRARIAELEAEIARLQAENARLKKNSSTSSKPPSSDIVKPPKPVARGGRKRKRRRGGQPGHPRHERTPYPPERVDHIRICAWTGKPLGLEWVPLNEFRTLQQVEGLDVSRGQLAKVVVEKVSAALGPCYEQLQAALPQQRAMNVDETGHPECGKRMWNWGFHVPGPGGFTWFHIDPSRSSQVLEQFLGETFGGVLGCDYYSAYRKFLDETPAVMQFCWAHLVRDVKFLTTLSDPVTRRFGGKLLAEIKILFQVWHRRDQTPAERWKRQAEKAKKAILKVARRAPPRSEAQNLAERFREYGEYYFTFLAIPGVEPTNNAMERGFRQLVIDRKVTQGTRGERGRRWCERIWTVLATCAQQARSAFQFLYQSIVAYFTRQSSPSLQPQGP